MNQSEPEQPLPDSPRFEMEGERIPGLGMRWTLFRDGEKVAETFSEDIANFWDSVYSPDLCEEV